MLLWFRDITGCVVIYFLFAISPLMFWCLCALIQGVGPPPPVSVSCQAFQSLRKSKLFFDSSRFNFQIEKPPIAESTTYIRCLLELYITIVVLVYLYNTYIYICILPFQMYIVYVQEIIRLKHLDNFICITCKLRVWLALRQRWHISVTH